MHDVFGNNQLQDSVRSVLLFSVVLAAIGGQAMWKYAREEVSYSLYAALLVHFYIGMKTSKIVKEAFDSNANDDKYLKIGEHEVHWRSNPQNGSEREEASIMLA